MTALDLPPPLWAPTNAAIIRPAEHALLRPGAFRPCSRAERWAIIADLVRTRRLTAAEAERALLFVPVVGWIAKAPPTLTYKGVDDSVTDGTSFSFSSKDIGTADLTRVVIAGLNWQGTGSTMSLISATIGGVSATIATTVTSYWGSAVFYAEVPTGTTANISGTVSASARRFAVGWWTAINLSSSTPVDADNSEATPSITLTTEADGIAVFCGVNSASGDNTFTWTNCAERYDVGWSEDDCYSGADDGATPAGSRTYGFTDPASSESIAGATWR